METTMTEAQHDLRRGYYSGAPYWALGLALAGTGFALAALSASAFAIVAAGAAIELVFALACVLQHRQWVRSGESSRPTQLRGAA
jgi:hypothetical protein